MVNREVLHQNSMRHRGCKGRTGALEFCCLRILARRGRVGRWGAQLWLGTGGICWHKMWSRRQQLEFIWAERAELLWTAQLSGRLWPL